MTRQAEHDAGQLQRLQERRAELRQAEQRILKRQALRERQARARRLTAVGQLVEAAGLLWIEDGVLEKGLAEIAERVKPVPTPTHIAPSDYPVDSLGT